MDALKGEARLYRPITCSIALLSTLAAPGALAASGPCKLDRGVRFPGAAAVEFWKRNPADTILPDSNASERARGYRKTTFKTFVAPGARISNAESGLVARQMAIALEALLAQPSLHDPHGVSVIPSLNMRRGDNGRIEANLSVMIFAVRLEDPATFQRDGGYFTPGEGGHIDILFNTPIKDVDPGPLGTCYEARIRRNSNGFAAYATVGDKSIAVETRSEVTGMPQRRVNQALLTPGLPATRLRFLDVQLKTGNGPSELARGKARMTGPVARAYAAVFMTDWDAVAQRMLAVR